jgi:hypothetical protein
VTGLWAILRRPSNDYRNVEAVVESVGEIEAGGRLDSAGSALAFESKSLEDSELLMAL